MLLQLYEQLVPMESERDTERMGYQKIPLILLLMAEILHHLGCMKPYK